MFACRSAYVFSDLVIIVRLRESSQYVKLLIIFGNARLKINSLYFISFRDKPDGETDIKKKKEKEEKKKPRKPIKGESDEDRPDEGWEVVKGGVGVPAVSIFAAVSGKI